LLFYDPLWCTVKNVMGFVVAAVGTALVWLPRLNQSAASVWPAVLATVGFWVLGGMLAWLKHR